MMRFSSGEAPSTKAFSSRCRPSSTSARTAAAVTVVTFSSSAAVAGSGFDAPSRTRGVCFFSL